MKTVSHFAIILLLASAVAWAASPPDAIHYQGVLRNDSDEPLDGLYDMQFRFWSAETGGDYILVDRHEERTAGSVVVTGGLFTVPLGTGEIFDGSGPGIYTSLKQMFRDYGTVYLEILIGFVDVPPETLSPRVPIRSGGYALNADHLDGVDSGQLLRKDTSDSFDAGTLTLASGTVLDVDGDVAMDGILDANGTTRTHGTLEIRGPLVKTTSELIPDLNADYLDNLHASAFAAAGHGHDGSEIAGMVPNSNLLRGLAPAFFLDTSSTSQTKTGPLTVDAPAIAVTGRSSTAGGYFESTAASGYAYLGSGDDGIEGWGNRSGGVFADLDSSGWAYVGYGSYKIQGVGSNAFVQKHPEDPVRVIVYNSPEGDEVANYTRGSARLVGGYARIPLGATFRWVTNPDVGLTAHVTPREACNGLLVESIGTDAITVRELGGGVSNASFDYIVYGLRIGFEEVSIVQEKRHEARIPSMQDHRDRYAADPSLARYNALERYLAMDAEVRGQDATPIDLGRSRSLRERIEEFDPAVHRPASFSGPSGRPVAPVSAESGPPSPVADAPDDSPIDPVEGESSPGPVTPHAVPQTMPVLESVRQGELLVADPAEPGRLRRSITPADPRVIGIALSDAAAGDGGLQVALHDSRFGTVWADASYGRILAGDLLVSSPTPGHAMTGGVAPPPGAVFAKSLEGLDSGTGLIRVVMTSR